MDKTCSAQLLFGGDFAPLYAYEPLTRSKGGEVFGDARSLIAQADFTIVNLETPLCNEHEGVAKAGPTIRSFPETLRALAEAGIDAVCLANNHIFDYGRQGLADTFSALSDKGIRHVGAGLDRDAAEAALRIIVHGKRISIFSFAEQEFNLSDDGCAGAAILDPLRIAPLLAEERAYADAILVCVHGGNEYFQYPRPGLRRICRFLVDMGADAVIGHHPHVPGPYEIYKHRPIVYSVGNLIFDHDDPPSGWNEGYLASLRITFGPERLTSVDLDLVPYRQSVAQEGIRLLQGADRERFITRIETMRDQLENHPDQWLAEWKRFVDSKRVQKMIDLSSPVRFPGLRRLMALSPVRNLIAPPSRQLHRLNLVRCESHRELMISALEGDIPKPSEAQNGK